MSKPQRRTSAVTKIVTMPTSTALSHEQLMALGFSERVTTAEVEADCDGKFTRFTAQLFVSVPGGQATIILKRHRDGEPIPEDESHEIAVLDPAEIPAFFDVFAALIERARADGILPVAAEKEFWLQRRA